jgi:hypothetical protein
VRPEANARLGIEIVNPDNDHAGLSLPGYTLSTRLGAGGYGEVWLAHAPGGLTKAVKFIFGSYNDKRAEHELRALQKVKEVRHPFLLSLERIEVFDGRLVIVTELAESSLKDRFDECRQEGLPGVPRTELLSYLRDAADALDYLSQKHSLQHLDVKPENLLLVAGHVKVADFGLVKDVGKSQASLVGGLTPLYSAPEVFQGNPSTHSDQYSLAVLYQEMLTGVLPFSGATAAELTLQHLHDEPDVSPLPAGDRYVLSRALAKEPSQRFGTCSELIAALSTTPDGDAAAWTVAASAPAANEFSPAQSERRPGPVTEFFGEQAEALPKGPSASMLLAIGPLADEQPVELPPLDLAVDGFAAHPTLVVGVGGGAGEVMKQLRLRLVKQFGDGGLPAFQMLLFDTDPKALARVTQGDARTALKPEETLALPLRRPQDYREQSGRLMKWLSRRWLYNIPRSLRTEGMRPLGRLALADHARQAVQRIRMALAQATDAEAIEASRERSGLEFRREAPRGYVIASISGGAGSGMSLDVGYAIRAALDKLGADDAEIVGVFLHSTGRDPRHCDLAKVNSFAWLTEYNHFHRPGGQFPGDESCGLPAMPPGRRAFDSAYLVDLGVEVDDSDVQQAAQAIAEYIYLDALTPAQSFFAECRREESAATATAPLRTFALHKIPAATDESIDRAAAALSRAVVFGWTGCEDAARPGATPAAAPASSGPTQSVRDTNQVVLGAAKLINQLQLQLEGLASNARSLVEAQFGGDQQAFLAGLATTNANSAAAADVVRAIDRLFATPREDGEGAYVLERPLEAIVSPLSMKLAADLARWVLLKLDDRQERWAGAQRAAQWLVDHLKRLESDAERLADGLVRQAASFVDEMRRENRAESTNPEAGRARALGYFRIRIDQHAVLASAMIAKRLLAELKSVSGAVAEFGRHLKHLASTLPEPGGASPAGQTRGADGSPRPSDPLAAALEEHLATLAASIDAEFQQDFIDAQGGLFQTIMGNSRVRAQMLTALNKLARQAAEQLAARPDVLNRAFAGLTPNDGEAAAASNAVMPPFLDRGGAYRKLAILPAQGSDGLTRQALGDKTTRLVTSGQDVITVCEGWRLPLVHLAVHLIQSRRDYVDFAARVHTRSDVPWTPLTSPMASASMADPFDGLVDEAPTMTQML